MKGTVRLLPCNGKTVRKGYVEYKGEVYQVLNKKKDEVLIGSITDFETEVILVNENYVKPLKYYVLGRRKVAELNYDDYNKIIDGDKVDTELKEIFNRVEVGDKVSLFKFKYNLCNNIMPIPGVISAINVSVFVVTLADGTEVDVRRHFFKTIEKPNKINIAWILKKL